MQQERMKTDLKRWDRGETVLPLTHGRDESWWWESKPEGTADRWSAWNSSGALSCARSKDPQFEGKSHSAGGPSGLGPRAAVANSFSDGNQRATCSLESERQPPPSICMRNSSTFSPPTDQTRRQQWHHPDWRNWNPPIADRLGGGGWNPNFFNRSRVRL